MRVLGLIVVGWLGFNVAVVVIAVLVAVATRNDAVHPDVHEVLDRARERRK